MAKIDIKATIVFQRLSEAYASKKYKGYVLPGGTRSSKTFSIIQLLIFYCQENYNKNKKILIARQAYSDLKDTVMRDFFDILKGYGLYKEKDHTRSNPQSYEYMGNTIYFRGLDAGGSHGEAYDVFWINETFEAELAAYLQLNQRLRGFFIMDYNPCFTEHWILEKVLKRPDIWLSPTSTILDNPFAPEENVKEVLAYDPSKTENVLNGTADDFMWKVYGLGEMSAREGIIFKYVNYIPEFPVNVDYWYGLDLGYVNDETALAKIYIDEPNKQLYAECLMYESTENPMLINDYFNSVGIERYIPIICDSSDKYISQNKGAVEFVKELKLMGWNISKVSKTHDRYYWIGKAHEYKLNIVFSKDRPELGGHVKKEFENFMWRRINGIQVNQPVDKWDHFISAMLYGMMGNKNTQRRKAFWN